jgi:hypothetical protein
MRGRGVAARAVVRVLAAACLAGSSLTIASHPSVVAAAISVPDPIVRIGFDEGAGATADDAAPGDHDGMLDGASWVTGQSGGALRFGGDGDRVDVDGNGLHHTVAITVSLWVRSSGNDPVSGAVIFEAGSAGCGAASYGIYATADGIVMKPPGSGAFAWDPSLYAGIDVWDGKWHHVAAAWNLQGSERLVVDGFELGGAAENPDLDAETNQDIALGGALAGGGCAAPSFRGDIDDLRIWSTSLDRDQLGSLLPPVTATVAIEQPEPVLPVAFDQCVQVAVDPPPPAGVVRVEIRDDEDLLVGASNRGGACRGWAEPPTGTWNVPVKVDKAGTFTAIAFYEPGVPWLPAQSEPTTIVVPRAAVSLHLVAPHVVPGAAIEASVRLSFADSVDRNGIVSLVDTTGDAETVVATTGVEGLPNSIDGVATFTIPGRVAGDYTFMARYSGTPELWAPSASNEVTVDVDDTFGDRGPITFGASPVYWTHDVLDVHAPADHASYVEVREPGGPWFRQGYNVPVIYPLDTFTDTPADGPITIQVRWIDVDERVSEIHEKTLNLDRTDPKVSSSGTPVMRATATSGTVPVRVGWSASDTTSGVASSDVQVSVNGGSYRTVTSGTTATGIGQRIASGNTFKYRMRTRDRAGNLSGWAYDRTLKPSAYNERSSIIRYSGSWAYRYPSAALGDRVRATTTAGSKASVTFKGRSYAWIATKGPTRGKAAIYVGGTKVATVDLYAPKTTYRQVVFTRTWSTTATRTVTIRALGTAGRPRIDIDGILLVR